LPSGDVLALSKNLAVRDPLLSPPTFEIVPRQFDVVVGNPPYGAPSDREYRAALRRALPLTTSNADLAVAFVERSLSLVKSDGRVGFVLPKPLTYSYAWRHVRAALRGKVAWLCDIGRGWEDVLLEQVLAVYTRDGLAGKTYRVSSLSKQRSDRLPSIPREWCDRFQVLLSGLSRADFDRLRTMQFSEQTVGDLCKTFRGLPWQRRIAPSGQLPLFGGRDLERWRVRSSSGYALLNSDKRDLNPFAQQKLLFQNIVAQIENPRPHVRLIGALDTECRVTLDTVNNLVPRREGVDLRAVLALLHSEPVNWLVYQVIYNGAIRTMHFDQYFLDKIPLPRKWDAIAGELSDLAEGCLAGTAQRSDIERRIHRVVADAYGEFE
jgi:hypothetical protein